MKFEMDRAYSFSTSPFAGSLYYASYAVFTSVVKNDLGLNKEKMEFIIQPVPLNKVQESAFHHPVEHSLEQFPKGCEFGIYTYSKIAKPKNKETYINGWHGGYSCMYGGWPDYLRPNWDKETLSQKFNQEIKNTIVL